MSSNDIVLSVDIPVCSSANTLVLIPHATNSNGTLVSLPPSPLALSLQVTACSTACKSLPSSPTLTSCATRARLPHSVSLPSISSASPPVLDIEVAKAEPSPSPPTPTSTERSSPRSSMGHIEVLPFKVRDYAFEESTTRISVVFNATQALALYDATLCETGRDWPITGDILWTLTHIGWINEADQKKWKDIDHEAYKAYQAYRTSPTRNCIQKIKKPYKIPGHWKRRSAMGRVMMPRVMIKKIQRQLSYNPIPRQFDKRTNEVLNILKQEAHGRIINPSYRPTSDPPVTRDAATSLSQTSSCPGPGQSRIATDGGESCLEPLNTPSVCGLGSSEAAGRDFTTGLETPTASPSTSPGPFSASRAKVIGRGLGRTQTFTQLEFN